MLCFSDVVLCLTTVGHKDADSIVITPIIRVFNPSSAVYLFIVQGELDPSVHVTSGQWR